MNLYEKIIAREEKISVIGLGYVGLPIGIAFSKHTDVIGFDVSVDKIRLYIDGIDPTHEVGNNEVKNTSMIFTSNEEDLKKAKFHIVAVPTPIRKDNIPDLTAVKLATKIIGRNITIGSYVVFESTVYPGVTEEICIPILEEESGFKAGLHFKVGYSPERINPGDKIHKLDSIVKVVSGIDDESLDIIAKVYELVVSAGIYKAKSIKVAEAAKVIENSQRDINIAFMNELSMIFNKMGIDTKDVLETASTKWNFLNFSPGLVGGHCIGVDPYYLTYKAEQMGYRSQIILSGRKINDDMGKYVVENLIKKLIEANIQVNNAKVAILGFTFKEDCPDTRNTRVIDIFKELSDYGITPLVFDPQADNAEVMKEYNLKLSKISDIKDMDAVVVAVAHKEFTKLNTYDFLKMFSSKNRQKVLLDLKAIYKKELFHYPKFLYWRL